MIFCIELLDGFLCFFSYAYRFLPDALKIYCTLTRKKNWLHLPHFLLYVFDWCPHFAFSMHLLVICDLPFTCIIILQINNPRVNEGANPDSKVHGANMGPTWALSVPDGPHVGPMNLAIWEVFINGCSNVYIFRIQVNTSWYTLLYATWVTR